MDKTQNYLEIIEGAVLRGGKNDPPTTPRPSSPIKGQGGSQQSSKTNSQEK
ncbi:MAG: hypothetical protein V2B14_00590 [bacterium]